MKGSFVVEPQRCALLVVDDEELNRDMLTRRLQREGYQVLNAEDGPSALAILDQQRIDLVVLDIMMPGMSGLEVLARLRKDHGPTELPVIMASARSDTEDVVVALKLGANDYVTKPLSFPVLSARVRTQLAMKLAVDAMEASEQRYRLLAEHAADMVSLHAPDGTFKYVSPSVDEILGRSPDELVGTAVHELFHPDDQASFAQREGLPDVYSLVVRMRGRGRWVWVEMIARSIRDPHSRTIVEVQANTREIGHLLSGMSAGSPPTPPPTPMRAPTRGAQPEIAPPVRVPRYVIHDDPEIRAAIEAALEAGQEAAPPRRPRGESS